MLIHPHSHHLLMPAIVCLKGPLKKRNTVITMNWVVFNNCDDKEGDHRLSQHLCRLSVESEVRNTL